jgi:16S rRNA (uracil1498-N3)-methyltransferase
MTGREFHHLAHAARRSIGDEIMLLDGTGGIHRTRVVEVASRHAVLRIVSSEQVPGPVGIDMALALIKAPRLDLAVEKCVELGVGRLLPVISERSVWRGGAGVADKKRERLRRKVRAACKQSGQPYFPDVSEILSFGDALARIPGYESAFVAEAVGRKPGESLTAHPLEARATERHGARGAKRVLGIVGPEGGFSGHERDLLARAGAVPVSLGGARLRSETAAICLLYRLHAEFGPMP